ncbi:MAG: bifunctional phosphopantothenoylcysteine decarboxylase/phosphopantothenate--cysteine ligase CoaBC [Calditrichaeota bacterium]|nr:MAG: bifunctional phosphopantothenoylcysteine decarboxylase/phosphopantothenate--cysteine ligase CoaBC [Calditrichota bacterium]MBL1204145.1 bifunctional phosphopantothenoylcysteine decarboxylase/phosphopantothenate--cysteine ligase CoaBC [Calditrichota bacterium]NOG43976.1 bifunctional phosphopantothenoylcysteine decarboxylase/phosphopantothenate--cysteine ligase CoaBC [Calditrichota bacterium]
MIQNKKSILIKDESNLLFFGWELLQKLNKSDYVIYLEKKNNYGTFLSFFSNFLQFQKGQHFDLVINFQREAAKQNTGELDYLFTIAENGDISPKENVGDFLDLIKAHFSAKDFRNRKILISAGPTNEDIDPVRFLSNRSTGKMGIALARAAYIRGADVKLIIGPGSARKPAYLNILKVRGAEEMNQIVQKHFAWCDFFISSAAVADYTPLTTLKNKMKKGSGNLLLEMKRTADILQNIQTLKRADQKVIGFSVETKDLIENSRKKLIRKNLDLIIANNPNLKGAGFAGDTNQVEIISKSNNVSLPLMTKNDVADKILDNMLEI